MHVYIYITSSKNIFQVWLRGGVLPLLSSLPWPMPPSCLQMPVNALLKRKKRRSLEQHLVLCLTRTRMSSLPLNILWTSLPLEALLHLSTHSNWGDILHHIMFPSIPRVSHKYMSPGNLPLPLACEPVLSVSIMKGGCRNVTTTLVLCFSFLFMTDLYQSIHNTEGVFCLDTV